MSSDSWKWCKLCRVRTSDHFMKTVRISSCALCALCVPCALFSERLLPSRDVDYENCAGSVSWTNFIGVVRDRRHRCRERYSDASTPHSLRWHWERNSTIILFCHNFILIPFRTVNPAHTHLQSFPAEPFLSHTKRASRAFSFAQMTRSEPKVVSVDATHSQTANTGAASVDGIMMQLVLRLSMFMSSLFSRIFGHAFPQTLI